MAFNKCQRLEEVAFNGRPALQQMLFDGWLLRFANGYTKRANSVNVLYPSTLDVQEKIEYCETLYRRQGLRPIFRLTSFSPSPRLDGVLDARGYQKFDLSLVLQRDLTVPLPVKPTVRLQQHETIAEWLTIFCHLSEVSLESHRTHEMLLDAIRMPRLLLSLVHENQVVACGLGVLDGDYFGLFDIVTGRQYRKRGFGCQLVSAMLHWAQQEGASYAYLQVVARNAPARHLYAKVGFEEQYQYWYRA